MKKISRIFTILSFLLLYTPLVVMILFSFNDGKSTSLFSGFSLRWYGELLQGGAMMAALRNSLILALCATILSTILGLLAAVGISKLKSKVAKNIINGVTNIPMMIPDIVTGVAMLLFFVFIGETLHYTPYRNFFTVLIAHVTFCLPYVILSITPKIRQMDKNLLEAAYDLGCTPSKAFLKVELPAIMPGVISGAIMAFTLSLDDFVISNFTCGQGFQTLPVYIYNMIKKRVTPDVYALYSIIFIVILALLLLSNILDGMSAEEKVLFFKKGKLQEPSKQARRTKNRITSGALATVLCFSATFLVISSVSKSKYNVDFVRTDYFGTTLYVYNWGEYIADGSDDTDDLIAIFEKKIWYRRCL